MIKRIISSLLALTLLCSVNATAYAATSSIAPIDPYSVKSKYVQQLVDISESELENLSFNEAQVLFEEAFPVDADDYSEDEVRLALDGLSFGLKFSVLSDAIRAAQQEENSNTSTPYSSTGNYYYTGSIGAAWVRDTRSGYSPLTLGELLSGTYTLEVDYLTWETAAAVLAASANYNAFNDLAALVATSAASGVIAAKVAAILGLASTPATVTGVIVSVAVGFGWNWLSSIDRSRMYDAFTSMSKSNYMKVQFMWSGNMVNKFYTNISKTNTISNPFPGTYGDWYGNKYGYLYNL